MKSTLLSIIAAVLAIGAKAQGIYGFYGGVSATTTYTSKASPKVGTTYVVGVATHVYLGGTMFTENYDLTNYDNHFAQFGGPAYTITHNTTYLYAAPKIEVAIGHQEYFRFFLNGGPGFLLSGSQLITADRPYNPYAGAHSGLGYDTAYTNGNITTKLFRIGLGATQHVPIFRNWDVTFTEELGLLPGWLSKNTQGYNGDAAMNMRSNSISVMVGISHRYRWEPIKPRRTWGGY